MIISIINQFSQISSIMKMENKWSINELSKWENL